ncbi:hypothetical protein ACFOY2_46110 [Nonomuraea purpurea]|uniref:Uncharacterized protein n=1 Tax=Nonomuraea purpurea TaxID=1849276 RepID=A0ABV8GLH7_9ACTN
MGNVINTPASAAEIIVGTLLALPGSVMPPALADPPATAVVIERNGAACIAAAALERAPFLTLRWDADAGQIADVAAWPDLHEARLAADSLRVLINQRERGLMLLQPHVYCRIVGADTSRWRVIGPSWGGTVEETGREGRVRVYADHTRRSVGTSASLRAGARRLARLNGMSDARLV